MGAVPDIRALRRAITWEIVSGDDWTGDDWIGDDWTGAVREVGRRATDRNADDELNEEPADEPDGATTDVGSEASSVWAASRARKLAAATCPAPVIGPATGPVDGRAVVGRPVEESPVEESPVEESPVEESPVDSLRGDLVARRVFHPSLDPAPGPLLWRWATLRATTPAKETMPLEPGDAIGRESRVRRAVRLIRRLVEVWVTARWTTSERCRALVRAESGTRFVIPMCRRATKPGTESRRPTGVGGVRLERDRFTASRWGPTATAVQKRRLEPEAAESRFED